MDAGQLLVAGEVGIRAMYSTRLWMPFFLTFPGNVSATGIADHCYRALSKHETNLHIGIRGCPGHGRYSNFEYQKHDRRRQAAIREEEEKNINRTLVEAKRNN